MNNPAPIVFVACPMPVTQTKVTAFPPSGLLLQMCQRHTERKAYENILPRPLESPTLISCWLVSVSHTNRLSPLSVVERHRAEESDHGLRRSVTKAGSPDFVPRPSAIATFDNDGTLWAEQPMYFQLVFALDRVKALAPQASRMEGQGTVRSRCSKAT